MTLLTVFKNSWYVRDRATAEELFRMLDCFLTENGLKVAESSGREASARSMAVRVEYYRSVEYCLRRRSLMNIEPSSKVGKASQKETQKSRSPQGDVNRGRPRSKRRRRAGGSPLQAGERCSYDIIDLIDSACDVPEEDKDRLAEIVDTGVDECGSTSSSVVSGPSFPSLSTTTRLSLCPCCLKRWQKAKKIKAPIRSKLLDNDPASLTCDQWVLLKKRKLKLWPHVKGKLLIHVELVKKRLAKLKHWDDGDWSACSRPHTFLHRNLRRCIKVQVKTERKKNTRTRVRNTVQGSHVAKRKRSRDNDLWHASGSAPLSARGHGANARSPDCSEAENRDLGNTCRAAELKPSTVAVETTKSRPHSLKKVSRFQDMLVQLRGKQSAVVRETR
ncbi:uncharacterized protein ACBR49_012187 [Aulostomus maculatus]